MLEKLRLTSKLLKAKVPIGNINNDILKKLIELEDMELIYLYIASYKQLNADDLSILVKTATTIITRENLEWAAKLKMLLKKLNVELQKALQEELVEFESVYNKLEHYVTSRSLY